MPLLLRALCCTVLLLLSSMTNAATAQSEPRGAIYVIGSLHELHERVPGFGYSDLAALIETIDPQVALLETRPDELSGRTPTPGRPEYPKVLWQYLAAHPTVLTVALEPGGKLFDQWVREASADAQRFEQTGAVHTYWQSYQRSLDSLLQAHWQNPAAAHDRVTSDLARSRYYLHYALAGATTREGQERWDTYMVEQALQAARAHPERRLLVLVSHRNRHRFVDALTSAHPQRMVEMEQWLRSRPQR